MVYLVLLEQLSRKTLLIFVFTLLIIQIIYFLVGGLIGLWRNSIDELHSRSFLATKPTHAAHHEFSICRAKLKTPWIYHGPKSNCQEEILHFDTVSSMSPALASDSRLLTFAKGKTWKDFVYVIQLPRITRWFQTLTSIIVPRIEYDSRITLSLSFSSMLLWPVRMNHFAQARMPQSPTMCVLVTKQTKCSKIPTLNGSSMFNHENRVRFNVSPSITMA